MRRRAFLAAFGAAAAWSMIAHAQRQNIPRLCFLTFDPGTLRTRSSRFDAFFQRLHDLGYQDGRTIDIRYLSAENDDDRFPTLIDECLSLKPAVIAVTTTPAAHLLKKATSTIPIVMVALGDPLGTGLVDNLSHPSGNITGMSSMVPELAVKRLELLRELVPGISRVLVLSYLADPIAPLQVKAIEQAAASLGLTLQVRDIRMGEDIPVAFEAGTREGAEGLLLTSESMFIVHRARVTELAALHRLPAVYPLPSTGSRKRWARGIRGQGSRSSSERRHACPPHLEWSKARRSAGAAADHVRTGHQPQDRQSSRPNHPANAPRSRRRGDRVRRRAFLAALSSAMVSSPDSFAQQSTLVRRITLILGNSEDDPNGHERLKLFRDSLRETGWVDGQNAAIKARWLAQNPDRALMHAKEVERERPDVVVVNGTPGLSALKQLKTTVPTVFVVVNDPVGER